MLTKKQCSQLKLLGTQFGGLAESPAEYSEKCGMYDEKELNCIRLNSRVQSLVVLNQANTLSSELKTRNAYTDILAKARKEFDDNNWKDILGNNHAFVKIANTIPTKVEALDDYVQITVKVNDLM
jgi:hypothetical protein